MSASDLALILGTAAAIIVARGIGPLVLGSGDRDRPALDRSIALITPAVLAGLVVTNALSEGTSWSVGPDTAGVVAGGAVLVRGASLWLAMGTAMAVAAAVRFVL